MKNIDASLVSKHEKNSDLVRLFRMVLASLLIFGCGVKKPIAQGQNKEGLPCNCSDIVEKPYDTRTWQDFEYLGANCINDTISPEDADRLREFFEMEAVRLKTEKVLKITNAEALRQEALRQELLRQEEQVKSLNLKFETIELKVEEVLKSTETEDAKAEALSSLLTELRKVKSELKEVELKREAARLELEKGIKAIEEAKALQ